MKIALEQGQGHLNFEIQDEKVIDVLTGRDVPALDHGTIQKIIDQGIRQCSPPDILHKTIAVIIPDDTRLWARGDLFVPVIIDALAALGVPFDRIRIIIALGTHPDRPAEAFAGLAGAGSVNRVRIINSAGLRPEGLVNIGTTSRGTPLWVTRQAWDADHIIIFGGILHHMLAGFGGGRKYILPGIAGEASIRHNHSLAMDSSGTPHPLVRQAQLGGNPVSEDMQEGADLFLRDKTACYVAVAANGQGEIFHAAVGDVEETFTDGCTRLNHACCAAIPARADFALFSAGGHRTDGQLYQSTKALFNAVNAVKEGGHLLFTAACSQGTGNETFARALTTFKDAPERLGRQLTTDFNMPAYVALRVIDLLRRFRITLVSDFNASTTRALGFGVADNIADYINTLPGRGYIIPFAENILPRVSDMADTLPQKSIGPSHRG
jgi:nickel-dependent lactate racemase